MTDNVKDTKPTIAVVTLHNSPNYGSCLQTYATQTVLSRIGLRRQSWIITVMMPFRKMKPNEP